MEADTGWIGERDPGAGFPVSLERQHCQKRGVQGSTHTAAPPVGVDVGGNLDTPPIGGPASKRTSVGVSGELALILGHQPGMDRHGPADPPCHLFSGRGVDLERDGGAPHDRRIDSLDPGSISWLGEADAYHDHQFRWSARHGIIHLWLTRS